MDYVTLAVGLTAVLLILTLKPIQGLIVYLGVVAWYPSYLAWSVGTIDFRVGRIAILAIFLKVLLGPWRRYRFQWHWLDWAVVSIVACELAAGATTTPLRQLLENRIGMAFDTALPYFAVRLFVKRREHYLQLLRGVMLIALPLAVFGMFQCVTGQNPLGFLRQYDFVGRGLAGKGIRARYGLYRGEATFPHAIMFGLYMALAGALCTGLWYFVRTRWLLLMGLGLLGLGMMASMSSGPWLAAVGAGGFMLFYSWRRHWPALVLLLVLCAIGVEAASDRHFYEVPGRFTLNPQTAWYRTRLMEVALGEGMDGHWLTGYGLDTDPGWGQQIGGQRKTDIVNHFLRVLARFGLVGLVPLLVVLGLAWQRLAGAFRSTDDRRDRWMLWCLGAALAGGLMGMVSVSLRVQLAVLLFVIIGLCGSAKQWVATRPSGQALGG